MTVGTRYGPDAPCQRAECATREPHTGGRHLDPRDELYDGPDTLLRVLPYEVRESACRLVREAPALMPEVVDLAEHIEQLRRQVAAVRVEADRKVHAAAKRAEDCQQHGRDIAELGRQLDAASRDARRNDAGRVVLVGLLGSLRETVREHREGWRPDLTVAQLMEALDRAVRKAGSAHDRAWKGDREPAPAVVTAQTSEVV